MQGIVSQLLLTGAIQQFYDVEDRTAWSPHHLECRCSGAPGRRCIRR